MKVLRILINTVKILVLVVCLLICIRNIYFKEFRINIIKDIPYQVYMVDNDSLMPDIYKYSLVVVKYENITNIEENDIIAVNKTEDLNSTSIVKYSGSVSVGNAIYYITKDNKNTYDTRYSDNQILGKSILVIPFIGYIALFINSNYFLLTFIIIIGIILVRKIMDYVKYKPTRYEIKRSAMKHKDSLIFEDLSLIHDNFVTTIIGNVSNYSKVEVRFLKVKVTYLSKNDLIVHSKDFYIVGKEGIVTNEVRKFEITTDFDPMIDKFEISIISYK